MAVKKFGFYTVKTFSEPGQYLIVVSFLEEDNYIYSKTYASSSRSEKHFNEIAESISYHHKNRYPWSYKTLNPKFYIAGLKSEDETQDIETAIFVYNGRKSNELLGIWDKEIKMVAKLFINSEKIKGFGGIPGTVKDGGVKCYKAMLKAFNLKKKGSK